MADGFSNDHDLDEKDYIECGCEAILADLEQADYHNLLSAFSSAAKTAEEEDRPTHRKVFSLLAMLCSMMLRPESVNHPFKPMFEFTSGSSTLPDDFSDGDVIFFSKIVRHTDNIKLKARLADLVWLVKRDLGHEFALIAIDAYRQIPLGRETWYGDGRDCWGRAISLSRSLGKGASDRIKDMEETLVSAFEASTLDDNYYPKHLAELLRDEGLGRSKSRQIAEKLKSMAHQFESESNYLRAVDYYQIAGDWYRISQDEAKTIEMIVCQAEGYVKNAEARLSAEQPSNIAAHSFFESAIKTYRSIPKNNRDAHGVDERIDELRGKMNDAGAKSRDEMGTFTVESGNVAEIVDSSRSQVSGKSPLEALASLAGIRPLASFKEERERAIQNLNEFPIQALFSSIQISEEGRTVAKQPGVRPNDSEAKESQAAIWGMMLRNHAFSIRFTVDVCLQPAIEIMTLEHRLHEADFINIARHSSMVPPGREGLVGKALFAGYELDYVTALHLLVPQIEAMVRWHLKGDGVHTTTLDANGIETECGLSTLMGKSEAKKVLGEDLAFEIEALFCDSSGMNLRNNLSHGLLSEWGCRSESSIYAWWLGFKIVFTPFWHAVKGSDLFEDERDQEDGQ